MEHGLVSKLVVGRRRRGDQEHHQRGHAGVKLGHLVGARQVIGDCERHDHRQYAHRHVEGDEQRELLAVAKSSQGPKTDQNPPCATRSAVTGGLARIIKTADTKMKLIALIKPFAWSKVALGAAEIGDRGQFFLKQGHELLHGCLLTQQRLGECQHVGGAAHAVVLCGDDRGRLTAPLLDGVELVGHLRPKSSTS